LYAAGVWLALQVADLLAQAGLVSDDFVRWMILLGLIFSPVTLALTWFFEHPWHGRSLGETEFIFDGYPIKEDTPAEG
ncbi:MAG: hypothetical protein O6946_08580, partial [Gammaproteobacteria bacterium]|nr:hypothetical protein [Gammaproteobacteria bacterium]